MNIQPVWLNELFTKKPNKYEEYFYLEIDHYLGIEFEDEKKDLLDLFNICGDYAKEFIVCKNKKEVKKWLNEIAFYVTNNVEVDYLIENYIDSKRTIKTSNTHSNNLETN